MRNSLLKLAVLGTLGLGAAQVMAASGFVSLPATGFAVGSNTSPYTVCNPTGNYGSGDSTEPKNEASTARVCAVFPNSANPNATPVVTPYGSKLTSPISGYTLQTLAAGVTVKTNSVIMNNTYTGGVNKTVATVDLRVWANSGGTSCIYSAQVHMQNAPISTPSGGTENWEVNDIAFGGFSGKTLSVAYFRTSDTDEVNFRTGRTYNSVQHRADPNNEDNPASGYVDQPLTNPGSTAAIVGVGDIAPLSNPLAVPTAAQQTASLNSNWVDFTTDINYLDPDGSTFPDSSLMYVQANACPAKTGLYYTQTANALRLRSTGQEGQAQIEATATGYVPSGATLP